MGQRILLPFQSHLFIVLKRLYLLWINKHTKNKLMIIKLFWTRTKKRTIFHEKSIIVFGPPKTNASAIKSHNCFGVLFTSEEALYCVSSRAPRAKQRQQKTNHCDSQKKCNCLTMHAWDDLNWSFCFHNPTFN